MSDERLTWWIVWGSVILLCLIVYAIPRTVT